MKIKTLKITGMEEVVRAICGEDGDSWATHLEDEHMQEAPFAFHVGEEDMKKVVEALHGDTRLAVRPAIRVYFEVNDAPWDFKRIMRNSKIFSVNNVYVSDYSDLIEAKYMKIDGTTFVGFAEILNFVEWIKTLPYQELLTA